MRWETSGRAGPLSIFNNRRKIAMNFQKSANAIDIKVGSNIRQRRVLLGMSQEKLAEGLQLTFQQVQKYEKGTNRVSASKLVAIAKILNCGIPELFAGTDAETSPAAAELAPLHSADALRIASNLDKLQPLHRRAVAKLIAVMANSEPGAATSD
jgi:transcriptional regulator with XRE-family HTH domain